MKLEIRAIRSFKVIGVGVMAVLVLGAAFASAAQAQGVFGSGKYPAVLKGQAASPQIIRWGGGAKENSCEEAAFSGEMNSASTALKVAPAYGKCVSTLGSLKLSPNGCTYEWTLSKLVSATEATGAEVINCPTGKEFKITLTSGSLLCEWGIAPQGPVGTIEYKNAGSGESAHVELGTNVTATATVLSGGASLCGASAGKTTNFYFSGGIDETATNAIGLSVGLRLGETGIYLTGAKSENPESQPKIKAETGATAQVAGDQDAAGHHLLKFGAVREIECAQADLGGELPGGSATEVPLFAEYTGCKGNGSTTATISMNSCHYVLGVLNVGPPYAGNLGIVCSKEGDGIELKVADSGGTTICVYKVASQSGLTTVGLETVGSGSERGVHLNLGLSGITTTVVTGSKIACGAAAGKTVTATYSGGSTLFGL